jgi:hypothetical protein
LVYWFIGLLSWREKRIVAFAPFLAYGFQIFDYAGAFRVA